VLDRAVVLDLLARAGACAGVRWLAEPPDRAQRTIVCVGGDGWVVEADGVAIATARPAAGTEPAAVRPTLTGRPRAGRGATTRIVPVTGGWAAALRCDTVGDARCALIRATLSLVGDDAVVGLAPGPATAGREAAAVRIGTSLTLQDRTGAVVLRFDLLPIALPGLVTP